MLGRLFWSIGSIYGLTMIQIYLNTDILEKRLYKIIYIILILIYASVMYIEMYNAMKECKLSNYIDKSICYEIKENINKYEQETQNKVELLKIKLQISGEGLSKKYKNIKFRQSYILASLSIKSFLELYCGISIDTQYITEKIIDFENDLDFYFVDNVCYIYMNL